MAGFTPLTAEAEISAPPDVVWQALVEFERYAEWNPWLVQAEGEATVGERVDVEVILGDTRMKARHRVLVVEPERELLWKDLGWFTVFARGQRHRWLEATETGTRYRVELRVTGPFAGTVEKKYGEAMRSGLEAETKALAERCAR